MSELAAILNTGTPVPLAGDRIAYLRLDFRALAKIEEEFGSLQKFGEALGGGAVVTSVLKALAWGLARDGVTGENVYETLDEEHLPDYVDALGTELKRVFGGAEGNGLAGAPGEPRGADSPGADGGTSLPSPSDGATTSSGT